MVVSNETMKLILSSLGSGKKAVNMGSSPVVAIEAAWQAESEGLVKNLGSLGYGTQTWWIELTDNGRKFVE